jgi:hypothetical protein
MTDYYWRKRAAQFRDRECPYIMDTAWHRLTSACGDLSHSVV